MVNGVQYYNEIIFLNNNNNNSILKNHEAGQISKSYF